MTISVLESNEQITFLKQHPVGVLATEDMAGGPHAVVIYFSVDEDLNILFTSKRDTRKSQNIAKNHDVCLVVFDAETQASLQIRGIAEKSLDEIAVQQSFAGTLKAAKQTGIDNVPPISKILAGPYEAYKITPKQIWMSEYGWGDSFGKTIEYMKKPHDTLRDPA